jgi:hypothetical protein
MQTDTYFTANYQFYVLHTMEIKDGHTRDKGGIGLSA